jgi:hypothetical protein
MPDGKIDRDEYRVASAPALFCESRPEAIEAA